MIGNIGRHVAAAVVIGRHGTERGRASGWLCLAGFSGERGRRTWLVTGILIWSDSKLQLECLAPTGVHGGMADIVIGVAVRLPQICDACQGDDSRQPRLKGNGRVSGGR